jgi:hypothetical protein
MDSTETRTKEMSDERRVTSDEQCDTRHATPDTRHPTKKYPPHIEQLLREKGWFDEDPEERRKKRLAALERWRNWERPAWVEFLMDHDDY